MSQNTITTSKYASFGYVSVGTFEKDKTVLKSKYNSYRTYFCHGDLSIDDIYRFSRNR